MNAGVRTNNYKTQVFFSFCIKGVSILLNFFQISLLYQILDLTQFSIWTTILSFTNWILFFDLGIGNGLRNKIAEAIVKNRSAISIYVSNSYVGAFFITIILLVTSLIFYYFLDWNSIYNTHAILRSTLGLSTMVSIAAIAINLTLSLVNSILLAQQRTAFAALSQVSINALFVGLLYFFAGSKSSILSISFYYAGSILFTGILVNSLFFLLNKEYLPSVTNISFVHFRSLFSLSISFFVVSLGGLVLCFCDNIIIAQLFGVEYVGDYNIIFRLYFGIYTISSLVITPLWSASSEAYLMGDYDWILKRIRVFVLLLLPLILVLILITLNIDIILNSWLGKDIKYDTNLLLGMVLYIVISFWNLIFSTVLNGIGNLKLSMICTCLAIVLNFVLSYFLGVILKMGTTGVIYSTVIAILPFSFAAPVHVYLIFKRKM